MLWTTAEFGFASLPEDVATGSSMMPQKLNPDVAELVRGKAGTAIGRLTGLLATVKGLPLAYNRDLQEDKPPVFAARADLRGALGALTALRRAGSSSTASGLPPPPPTRSCSRPTRPKRSCGKACRSATRTSRSPAPCATGPSSRRSRLHGPRRGRVASARRSPPREGVSKPCDAAASGGVSTV